MNTVSLGLLLMATAGAAWSAADVGMAPGAQPLGLAVAQRGAAPAEPVGRGCGAGSLRPVLLRAPLVDPAGLAAAEHVKLERAVIEDWRRRMRAGGVPDDLIERTLRMPNRVYEPSSHEMKRLSCTADGIAGD